MNVAEDMWMDKQSIAEMVYERRIMKNISNVSYRCTSNTRPCTKADCIQLRVTLDGKAVCFFCWLYFQDLEPMQTCHCCRFIRPDNVAKVGSIMRLWLWQEFEMYMYED